MSSQAQQLSSLPTDWLALLVDQSDLLLAGVQAESCHAERVICKQAAILVPIASNVTDMTVDRCKAEAGNICVMMT